jgi:hypothetical protein
MGNSKPGTFSSAQRAGSAAAIRRGERRANCCNVLVRAASLLLAAVALPGQATSVLAHQTGGWTYPLACCRGDHAGGDCERIPNSAVRAGSRGFSVVLEPGDHHLVTRRQAFLVPYGNEIPSGDGDFHICLHPSEDHMNCFFAPPYGA